VNTVFKFVKESTKERGKESTEERGKESTKEKGKESKKQGKALQSSSPIDRSRFRRECPDLEIILF